MIRDFEKWKVLYRKLILDIANELAIVDYIQEAQSGDYWVQEGIIDIIESDLDYKDNFSKRSFLNEYPNNYQQAIYHWENLLGDIAMDALELARKKV